MPNDKVSISELLLLSKHVILASNSSIETFESFKDDNKVKSFFLCKK